MKISIVIVNYNVKHFLEQCLNSVYAAINHCDAEVFVVDNNSVDGSNAMVKQKFPLVRLIENQTNFGFSYANNQAIKLAKAKYILLLNPDTVIEEKTLSLIADFMDNHPDAGGLGVKMIDGKGKFLPESKRGLPTPKVAFFKIFGLSKLFPKSKKFGQYHLSYLDKDEVHQVDVLSGAFLLLRKETLNKCGLLDENFFMYGEDIDLSYRITKSGYKNYYFPGTTIIHYKGESTKKGSINYVIVFYRAMIIFAKKHFSQKNARTLIALINIAIYLRASVAIVYRFVRSIIIPLIDAMVILAGFFIITPLWSDYKFGHTDAYPADIFSYSLAGYVIIWLFSLFFSGAYDRPVKIFNVIKGIVTGALIILIIYSLVPEELRTSRALILLGSLWTLIIVPLFRYLLAFSGRKTFRLHLPGKKRVVIVGNRDEAENITQLLDANNSKLKIEAYVYPGTENNDPFFAGKISQLDEIVKINKLDEIIFCAKDLQAQQIISTMLMLNDYKLDYKITSQDGVALIGSNDINAFGDLYDININSIAKPANARNKRFLDFIIALNMLISYPIIAIIIRNPGQLFSNIISILFGNKSFVSYSDNHGADTGMLPRIKKGVLSPIDAVRKDVKDKMIIERINFMYAKDYKIISDLNVISKAWRKLGNR
jgi:O-antigen biosynthesis protein